MGWFSFLCPQREEISEILVLVRQIAQQQEVFMARIDAELQRLFDKVAQNEAVGDSVIVLLTGIKQQLDAALAGELSAAQQVKVDEIFAKVESDTVKVEAAILANTPQAPPA